MPPRAPGDLTHEGWKGMAQPVGLVVEPMVLNRPGIFPESAFTVLADCQQRLEELLEDQPVGDQAASEQATSEQWLSMTPSFVGFSQEVQSPDWFMPEHSPGDGAPKAQLLVYWRPPGTPFDALPKGTDGRRRVIVIDASNEIAGDSDIPHPATGHARRMQVARVHTLMPSCRMARRRAGFMRSCSHTRSTGRCSRSTSSGFRCTAA